MNNINSCYIHIPFCKKICSYCDFCKLTYNKKYISEYLNALEKEIKTNYNNDLLKTIYIGGGTPSSLDIEELNKLFNILKLLNKKDLIEYTFEMNIEDVTEDKLNLLKDNHVNRLSIGIESFNKDILDTLGRPYISDIKEKINLCKKYFNNINIDLIYGIKDETINKLDLDLKSFLELNINHISLYCLILEENTILKINNYKEASEDLQRDMYDYITNKLLDNDYIQYEISNFSKKGYESIHNLTYWNNEEYYGFGLGASGFINNNRYENTRSITNYLKEHYKQNSYEVSDEENMENEMILGLRKIQGVSKEVFFNKYHKEIKDVFNTKNLEENKEYFYISKNNLFISNYILNDFVDNF